MLKQLSRFKGTSKVLIWGFIAVLAAGLVLFFKPAGSGSGTLDPTKSTEVLASVAGDDITVGDFVTQKQSIQQQFSRFGGQISLLQMGYTDERILTGLILKKLTVQEAERLGLGASEAEVKERIAKTFSDASGKLTLLDASGRLDMSKYQERVPGGDVSAFERGVAEEIAREKLEAFVAASVRISEDEVREDYKRKNTTFDLTYVTVSAGRLAEKIQPTDAELKDYYEKHKTDYNILVPQKKIRYVFIDQDKSGQKVQISDKELHDEFDNLKPEFKQAGVKVQQIVLRVARPDLDAQVKAKADGLVAKARGTSTNTTEEAFADLAKGNSEDPGTAKNGGRVNGVVKKDPNKTDDPRGYTIAQKIAQKAQDRLKETKDPQKVAQELGVEANMTPAEMVRETPFVKPGDDVPNIGSSPQFEEAIAPLNKPNDVGDRTQIKNGFAVPMLVDKRDPRIPDFEEVKDKVTTAVKEEKAKAQLEEKAKELIATAKSPGDLKAAAERLGLEAKAEANYKLATPLGEAGSSVLIDDPLYASKAGEVIKTPIFLNQNYLVIGVTKRTEADLTEYAKQRDSLMQAALTERKNQIFDDYLAAVQKRMENSGKIKINKDVLIALQDEEPEAAPRQRARLPVRK